MPRNEDSKFMIRNGVLYKSCPACSTGVGKTIFYPCPEYFGYRYNYSQSLCTSCRGRDGNPTSPREGYTMLQEGDLIIPEIRMLPMSKEELLTFNDCINFLTEIVPFRGNTYYYKKHNIMVKENTLVLFQYSSSIVGYAILECEKNIENNHPLKQYGYNGYYKFKENSIKILSNPITSETFNSIFGIVLSQASTKIKLSYLPKLIEIFGNITIDNTFESIVNTDEKHLQLVEDYFIDGVHEFSTSYNKITTKDYIKAQKNQTIIGEAGEELVFKYEKEKLIKLGLTDLANKVENVSKDSSYGYDIKSYDENGNEIHIEVKTKSGKLNYLDFYLTDRELLLLTYNDNHLIYYISHLRSSTPQLFILNKKMIDNKSIKPVLYRISLNYHIDEDE